MHRLCIISCYKTITVLIQYKGCIKEVNVFILQNMMTWRRNLRRTGTMWLRHVSKGLFSGNYISTFINTKNDFIILLIISFILNHVHFLTLLLVNKLGRVKSPPLLLNKCFQLSFYNTFSAISHSELKYHWHTTPHLSPVYSIKITLMFITIFWWNNWSYRSCWSETCESVIQCF